MNPNDSTLFVTSFDRELYVGSGRRLVESFRDIQGGNLLVCGEGPGLKDQVAADFAGAIYYDLDGDTFLRSWLTANRDIIPDYLGGNAKECSCPGREKRHAKHAFGCRWQWMNRNASRWFRKVVSLRRATTYEGLGRTVVWLDSDVYFKSRMGDDDLARILDRSAMFYCRGHRPAVESGILGLSADLGLEVVRRLCKRYVSGRFRRTSDQSPRGDCDYACSGGQGKEVFDELCLKIATTTEFIGYPHFFRPATSAASTTGRKSASSPQRPRSRRAFGPSSR